MDIYNYTIIYNCIQILFVSDLKGKSVSGSLELCRRPQAALCAMVEPTTLLLECWHDMLTPLLYCLVLFIL